MCFTVRFEICLFDFKDLRIVFKAELEENEPFFGFKTMIHGHRGKRRDNFNGISQYFSCD